MATQDEYIKTALRLPRGLHKDVQDAAEANGRSMNAEIIERLEQTFSGSAPSDALLSILRLEREKIMSEAQWDLTKQSLYSLAHAFLFAEKHMRPRIEHLEDLVEVFEHAKEIAEKAIAEHEKNPLQALNKKLQLADELSKKIQHVSMQVSTKIHFPHPDQVFEEAVQSGDSAEPAVMEERERRGLLKPLEVIENSEGKRESSLRGAIRTVVDSKLDRTALTKNLAAVESQSPKPPSTPTIPGVNAPKRGLGSKPKTPRK